MSGIFLVDSIRVWKRRKEREKRLRLAQQWPIAMGEVNHWEVVEAYEETTTPGASYQIEAGFHFTINGEYFGGYLRSVAMGHHEAKIKAKESPAVKIRYDSANPNSVAVLAEDNGESLPFRVFSG